VSCVICFFVHCLVYIDFQVYILYVLTCGFIRDKRMMTTTMMAIIIIIIMYYNGYDSYKSVTSVVLIFLQLFSLRQFRCF